VPRPLAKLLVGHTVDFADELGWRALANGDLLTMAESSGFDSLVTADTNLRYQQNLARRRIAIVTLSTNAWRVIRENADAVAQAVNSASHGSYQEVDFARPPLNRRPPPKR
jgi:hypothetical protein